MNRPRRLAATAAVASLVLLGACAPPEDDDSETTTESGVSPSEATSAEDFGGMEALIEAAQEEGTLNVIALPPDWANYGEIIDTFAEKYDIEVNSDQPDRGQPGRDQRGQRPQGHRPGPRRLRPRSVGRAGQHRPVRAVPGGDLRRHPRRVQGPGRHLGQRLRRLHVDRLRLGQGARRDVRRGPARPRVQGQGRPERQPDRGRRRLQRRDDGLDRQRRLGRRHRARRRLLQRAQGRRQLPARSTRLRHDRVRPDPGRHRLGLPECRGRGQRLPPGRRSSRRRPSWPATTTRRSTSTRRTRPPPACGRSSSTATRARTSGSRAVPVRCAADAMAEAGTIDAELCDALPAGRPARR